METKLYNQTGKEVGTLTVPEALFGLPWNADLVHQVVTVMRANIRPTVAHTKDRGEVRGGGKKPWQQKGTGRARHGSSRSPIWKGGGVTHGPRNEKDYSGTVSRQMRQKALLVALSRKLKDGEIIFMESLSVPTQKTKDAKAVLAGFSAFAGIGKKKNAALIALPSRDSAVARSFRNIGNVAVEEVGNLNPLSVLSSKYLLIAEPKRAFETLGKKKVVKSGSAQKN